LASLRKNAERLALVPGDLVTALALEDGGVVVERREPRSFALQRTTSGGRTKTMAANVDGIAVVAAMARPPPNVAMLDELLAFAQLHDIGARLIFTKPDLVEDAAAGTAMLDLYRSLGYTVLVANPKTGEGIAELEADLARRKTLLIGQSGVGKSSLFRALGGTAEVGDVSKLGRGKQTTTAGRLHRFAEGFLIDSPGVGEFELYDVAPAALARGFVEFSPFIGACRFTDCTHLVEPGCAVRAAMERGEIAASRYASFRAIAGRAATGARERAP
jgi:ribosome biogenesis GTPase